MLTANGQLDLTWGQNCSIGREGSITPPGGKPPDEAYDLTIDSESLICVGEVSDLSTSIV